jgi:hypothetical protein
MIQKKNLKVGQQLTLPPGSKVWVVKTPGDIRLEEEEDKKIGRFLDSGGEPLLYSKYSTSSAEEAGLVSITTKNPEWNHWYKKPSFLVGAYSETLRRNIVFTLPKE